MILSIHQPMYIPWIGFFQKWTNSDVFVILDDAEYSKNNFFNRNKIKTDKGHLWLTVPVIYKGNSRITINNIKINNQINWNKKHWKSIKNFYSKAKYFSEFSELFEQIYGDNWEYLCSLNMKLLLVLSKILEIDTKIVYSSSLNISGNSTERLINICKELKADEYLSGTGAKDYLDIEQFTRSGIKLKFQKLIHPVYPQMYGEFLPCMSIIDMLFNCGHSDSIRLLNNV